jgi:hypothetical protein
MSEPARHLERGARGGSAMTEALDRAPIIREQGELDGSPANPFERADRRSAGFLGRPDDWDATTGRRLAEGT